MEPSKTPRRRVANFTAEEKVRLAQLINENPIVLSKLTDGKSVTKKKAAWELITTTFNADSNGSGDKRDTVTLKRAWDNLKASNRKAQADEQRDLLQTERPSPMSRLQRNALISMNEEDIPLMKNEIRNNFGSNNIALGNAIDSLEDLRDPIDNLENVCSPDPQNTTEPLVYQDTITNDISDPPGLNKPDSLQGTSEYIKREAVTRLKYLETKTKLDIETAVLKKRTAELDEERSRILLEIAKLEYKELKSRLKKK